ncbi:phosphonate metabolism transcriptional regulator PhnF [Phyllobacterium sp. 628]|uniref:phosphonate metabolism transcriptional regulator PhnF n=1 Tax=Phyllobacterium sp. 628 TaxID=2718938 RepID=UPI0016626955|nr:phosphonate metabolism transcriptional regulator PhnF [Phyllobacterium sp. 628]QND52071.1 phosphonate metabolism transcriptional regulator PhnF [Phyllobacterium sp. 628]
MDDSGLALWRQIGNVLSDEIEHGDLSPDQRLPSSEALAARFGVNRHTVLKAINHLQSQGKVRIERGRGSFAVVNKLDYNIGSHQLFEQNLAASNMAPSRTVLAVAECHAPGPVAEALKLAKGRQVLLVTTLGEADGITVNYGNHYIASDRLPGIVPLFKTLVGKERQAFSFRSLFEQCSVRDYHRKDVTVRSRPPTNEETRYLNIPTIEYVLTTLAIGVGTDEVPLTYAEMAFASSRVSFKVSF